MERPRPRKSEPSGTALLTPRQVIALLVLSVLGLTVLGVVAVRLLSSSPVLPSVEQAAAVPALPTVDAPILQAPVPDATLAPGSVLPAGCEPAYGSLIESPNATVLDSQTIEVSIGQSPVRVSFAGIALPNDQPAASAAVAEIRSLIDGQPVVLALVESTTTADGSSPAYLYANGWFLNHELVLRGMARVDPSVPGQSCAELFLQAERQAQAAHTGLWQPTGVPTATFVPTVGFDPALQAPCDCMVRPVCGDFSSHDEAQACYNACNDYNSKLDDDRDGLACEWLP